jgi:hypothetical protein
MILTLTLWLLGGHKQVLHTRMPNGYVDVVNCKTKVVVTLYSDATMAIVVPNPIKTDTLGNAQFYVAKNECVDVIIMGSVK